jgi:uncharacterized protein involved in response to NO
MACDIAFAVAAAVGIAIPLSRADSFHNYAFVATLLGMGVANAAFYLGSDGVLDLPVERALQFGLDLILFVMTVLGGRVIPMFTANGVPGSGPVRHNWLERVAMASVLALLVTDCIAPHSVALAAVAVAGAIIQAWRWLLWKPWRTLRVPLVWILHVSYAWIPLYLALRAAACFDLVPASIATHALTVGAIGGLTIGMMTRTARGHTGRPLQADAAETMAYLLVQFAAACRVLVPLASAEWYRAAVIGSGALWALAFALFAAAYWPVLSRPRLDGRPG